MEQQGQSGQGNQMGNAGRPAIMNQLTTTQVEELERHFSEGNRDHWNQRTSDYGWSEQQSQEVWRWFENQPGNKQSFSGG